MPISLNCPQCNGKLRVADNLVGKKIKCPKCAALLPVVAPEDGAIAAKPVSAKNERIAATIPLDDQRDDEDEPVRPRKIARNIRQDSASDAVSTIIPYKNGRALAAYYLGVFSFIPCVGLLLGPAALVLGILGFRYVKANQTAHGTGHAIAGIIMGTLTTLINWGLVVAGIIMGGIAAFNK